MNGVGATRELSLRVSVATLVRVLFQYPKGGDLMLALERKATLQADENGYVIEINSQPFGGAIHICDMKRVRDLIGDFHFDSEPSRSEQDFRIFIRPSDWETVRKFCLQQFGGVDDSILETDPKRELAEEFADALKIRLNPDQYILKPIGIFVEGDPAPTHNLHAKGYPTARVYRIFEATIADSSLAHTLMRNSENFSDQDLGELALQEAQKGEKGRANAILALPVKLIREVYLTLTPNDRNMPVIYEKHRLDETVPLVLEDMFIPKYQRL
jgi:hypothetical protein